VIYATQEEHRENIIKYREYYNRNLSDIGFEAPTPKANQTGGNYRRSSLQHFADRFLPQLHDFAKMNYLEMPYDVLKIFEPQVLKACVDEYHNPNNVPLGEIRAVPKRDPLTNTVSAIDYVGRESFVKQMGRAGRRVISFRTPNGFVDASGRGLR
jgi:hypothetical protein